MAGRQSIFKWLARLGNAFLVLFFLGMLYVIMGNGFVSSTVQSVLGYTIPTNVQRYYSEDLCEGDPSKVVNELKQPGTSYYPLLKNYNIMIFVDKSQNRFCIGYKRIPGTTSVWNFYETEHYISPYYDLKCPVTGPAE